MDSSSSLHAESGEDPSAKNQEMSFPPLKLPAELRNNLYRYAVVHTSSIEVDANGLQEPALLSTSKQIRKEAAPIFWAENNFNIIIVDFNITAYMKWKTMAHSGRRRKQSSRIMAQTETPAAPLEVYVTSDFSGVKMDCLVLEGLFSIVKAMRKTDWAEVLSVLEKQRVILGRVDARWNDER